MISSLFSGVVRAKIWCLTAAFCFCSAVSWSHSTPVIVCNSPSAKPSCCPIAAAVNGASPVIILTSTLALFISRKAAITSGRGGSMIPVKPRKVKPDSRCLCSSSVIWSASLITPKATTRLPWLAKWSALACQNERLKFGSCCCAKLNNLSGAPFR